MVSLRGHSTVRYWNEMKWRKGIMADVYDMVFSFKDWYALIVSAVCRLKH